MRDSILIISFSEWEIDLRHVPVFESLAFPADKGWVADSKGYIVRWLDDPRFLN
jgi:hypothetical protein